MFLNTPTYIFPRPTEVARAAADNAGSLGSHLLVTLTESALGFLAANIISVCLAFVAYFKPKFENYILSAGVVIKTIPIIALTPLLIMWFGSGIASKVATAALICFFPALVNMVRGMKSLESNYHDLFKVYSTPPAKLIKLLLIPGSFPFLISSFKISSSLAVVGALVGEFIGANKGLGFVILVNYYNFNMPLVFAAILLSSFLGLAYYYLLHIVEKEYARAEGRQQ
jgi:NitT/TauT family transport system permease protein